MRSLLATLFFCALFTPAQAQIDNRFLHLAWGGYAQDVTKSMKCPAPLSCKPRKVKRKKYRKPVSHRTYIARKAPGQRAVATINPGARLIADAYQAVSEPLRKVVLGGRPTGCPHRYCGCALSIRLFGRIIPTLNLADNWRRLYARVEPAPNMVAARRGHVFQLLSHVRGHVWRVWDANSGRGRIHIHNRSIARYTIVNPHRRVG